MPSVRPRPKATSADRQHPFIGDHTGRAVSPVGTRLDVPAAREETPSAAAFLAQVEGWILKLAAKLARRVGMSPAEFANEVRIDVFLHLGGYDPGRGRPTTWVAWRVRKVFSEIRRGGQRRRAIRPRPFSALRGADRTGDGGDAAGGLAVAPPDPLAGGGGLQRGEDEAELRAAVRAAVAGLSAAQRRAVEVLYGIGREAVNTRAGLQAATGVTAQAVHLCARNARKNLRRSVRLRELARDHGLRPAEAPSADR
ncbi:MAG TPA: hypothetical protein VD866_27210 [Urbifossiella sp.]|nr:hypothetical protein [Urbifossiella sp.]